MSENLPGRLERIRLKLREADKRDSKRVRFGSSDHRYRLKRPISEKKIVRFEERHGIRLPEDFRLFITTLGNGGAGPTYGMKRFNPSNPWYEGPLNWAQEWRNTNFLSDEELNAAEDCGTIFLYEHGCGMYDFLVVTGPEAGTVWFSDSICMVSPELSAEQRQEVVPPGTPYEEAEKILQKADFPQRSSFLDHYERWLDSCLETPARPLPVL